LTKFSDNSDKESSFCAGKRADGIGICRPDFGAPLICIDENNQPVLYGLVSHQSTWCWYAGRPAVYSKVAAVVGWIMSSVV